MSLNISKEFRENHPLVIPPGPPEGRAVKVRWRCPSPRSYAAPSHLLDISSGC
jgi:hypothetical protein